MIFHFLTWNLFVPQQGERHHPGFSYLSISVSSDPHPHYLFTHPHKPRLASQINSPSSRPLVSVVTNSNDIQCYQAPPCQAFYSACIVLFNAYNNP